MPKGLPKPERLSETISLKLSRSQVKRMREASSLMGQRFGAWAREVLVAHADAMIAVAAIGPTGKNGKLDAPELPKR